jgi:4-amino-4-deoxy-L-arabinose transferase-like glycosyltransferase
LSRKVGLVAILILAAALRLVGLGWGLRHRPPLDERFFVMNAASMLARGNLDHGFYLYPGLFYYILAPVLTLVENPQQNPNAFLAARYLVALFGVATAALAYALGRRLFGTATGLLVAALLAVSPLEIRVGHQVRPDIVLEAIVLLAFFAFRRVGEEAKGDVLSGVSIGAATAVKFSGALIAPSYLVARIVAPGSKLRRLALAALVSLIAFAILSPYTFLRGAASVQGMDEQLSFHYLDRPADLGRWGTAAAYAATLIEALGAPALLLAVAGLVVGRGRWREWLPLLVLPLVTLAVFSTATITQDRFLIPTLGVTALLAGPAVEALAVRRRLLLWAVAALVVIVPLISSIEYIRAIAKPITKDVAADWIESHAAEGRVVTTANAALGLDPHRFETLVIGMPNPGTRLQALQADLVVTGPTNDRAGIVGLKKLFVAEPLTRYSGDRIRVYAVPAELRPPFRAVDLSEARLTSSETTGQLPRIHDGDASTAWETTEAQAPGEWVQIDLPHPRLLGRIEIVPPADVDEMADEIQIFASEGAPKLERAPFFPGRPALSQQRGAPSQVLLLPEVRAVTVRLVQVGRKTKRWGIAELRLEALD